MSERVVEKKKKLSPVEAAKLEAEEAMRADEEARKRIEDKALKARQRADQEAIRARQRNRYALSMKDVSFLLLFVIVFVAVSYVFSLL